ncbi:MAG: hypothetical protein WC441_01910 [Patescibacteria group bacterium]
MEYILAVIQFIPNLFKYIKRIWKFNLPAGKVLGSVADNNEELKIFVKDLIVLDNIISAPKLISKEGEQVQYNPNIEKVWPDVEAIGVAKLFNLLGQIGKNNKLSIIEMSVGFNMWDSNLIVLGAQSFKSREFYRLMENVGYRIDDSEIYDNETGEIIERENGYGYGLIIKATNGKLAEGKKGLGFLLGGYGVLGTQAAVYYFCNNISQLGKMFGRKKFSIIVRAKISVGEQSVERLDRYNKVYSR